MIPAMKAAFLAIGSELLGIDRLDTNSLAVTVLLERYGVEMRRKAVAGDSVADIERELLSMAAHCDLVFISGGLGPTADDVTREAVAQAFGLSTREDPAVVEAIRERFRQFGWEMPEVNRRQAMVLSGAELIANPRGTAPGQFLQTEGGALFLLPGVPGELHAMLREFVEPWLEANTPGQVRETRVLKVSAVPESELEERIAPAYEEFGRENITIPGKTRGHHPAVHCHREKTSAPVPAGVHRGSPPGAGRRRGLQRRGRIAGVRRRPAPDGGGGDGVYR